MNVRVIKPGLLTTIQDRGRWGLQSHGVPVAGPMDPVSHRLANALVGNDAGAATLEITLIGPELEFEGERVVAVAGAEFEMALDSRAVPMHAPFIVSAESRLRFGARRLGARAYLAIAGGLAIPPTFGSRSTHLISAMGGVEGRALKAGDRLPLGDTSRARRSAAALSQPLVPLPDHHARLRVLPGPQAEYFTAGALDLLQSQPYVVGQNSDRMGFRLEGPRLTHARGADIISDATPLGVLQVPASGQPILLMADRQTSGGYPKIATLISADVSVAGQLGPGDTIAFTVCEPREAMAALIAQERALMAIESPES
ncbi:MAG TPA: biotin-dependent carboxyltransferase family protein [Vicinamibacterales bacterium]|jgi:antagonist of KipI|nr:biotin-dependent carboxyltransferase family protein [Vicinamibacterales bacterium]